MRHEILDKAIEKSFTHKEELAITIKELDKLLVEMLE